MRCDLTERGQVRVAGFEVTDVGLVLDDWNAIDIGGRSRRVRGLPDAAVRRYVVDNLVGGGLTIDRRAAVAEIEIAGLVFVLLNDGLLALVEQAAYPIEEAPLLGGQAQPLRPRLVVEFIAPDDERARVLAVDALVEREVRVYRCQIISRMVDVVRPGAGRSQGGEAQVVFQRQRQQVDRVVGTFQAVVGARQRVDAGRYRCVVELRHRRRGGARNRARELGRRADRHIVGSAARGHLRKAVGRSQLVEIRQLRVELVVRLPQRRDAGVFVYIGIDAVLSILDRRTEHIARLG